MPYLYHKTKTETSRMETVKSPPLSYSGFPENPVLVSRETPRSTAVSGWEVEHHWLRRGELVHQLATCEYAENQYSQWLYRFWLGWP